MMKTYFSWMCLLSSWLAWPMTATAGTSAAAVPDKDQSLPRSWYATHTDEGPHMRLMTFKTLHEEVNPILHQDWEAQTSISRSSDPDLTSKGSRTIAGEFLDAAHTARTDMEAGKDALVRRLARLTAYWGGERGDPYTAHHVSSTGIHLHVGHCAVDPTIIPYGSVVEIPGVGDFLAVDTGSAVVSRTAARKAGHTSAERDALVIDLFFEQRSQGERFAALAPKFVSIKWWTPSSTASDANRARKLFAGEDWSKIYSKQLITASFE